MPTDQNDEIREGRGLYRDLVLLRHTISHARPYFNILNDTIDVLEQIPSGWCIAVRPIALDIHNRHEFYLDPYTHEFIPMAHACEKARLAAQAEVVGSRRVDDASQMNYCQMAVRGRMRAWDRTWRGDVANAAIDLRDGAGEIEEIRATEKNPDQYIRRARMSIVEHAETNARNRLFRKMLAFQPGYSPEELEKPFVVVTLVRDPRAKEDDELEREAEAARSKLFGEDESRKTPPPVVKEEAAKF